MIDALRVFRSTELPTEAEALRSDVRATVAELVDNLPVERRVLSWSACDPAVSRALGAAGYIGTTLPVAFGGAGKDAFTRFVISEELLAQGAPVAAHWIADRQSATQILRFGSDAQQASFLPGIARGELYFCIGMSEPGAGSDLAAVKTRAVREGAGWRLNGQKTWTTGAATSQFMIALVRTSDDGKPHLGLSQFIVDLSLPGVTVRPIMDVNGDRHFAEVFFDDVLLPAEALLGGEGQGWRQVTAELAMERSGPERIYSTLVLLDEWIRELQSDAGGKPATAPDAADRQAVGGLIARLAVLRAMSLAVTAELVDGGEPMVAASIVKDLGTSFEQDVVRTVADRLFADPDRAFTPALRQALSVAGNLAPAFSLRGGTREILRTIISRSLTGQAA